MEDFKFPTKAEMMYYHLSEESKAFLKELEHLLYSSGIYWYARHIEFDLLPRIKRDDFIFIAWYLNQLGYSCYVPKSSYNKDENNPECFVMIGSNANKENIL